MTFNDLKIVKSGAGGRIRTGELLQEQILSLSPLT